MRADIFIAAALQGLLARGVTTERAIVDAIDIGTRLAKMTEND